MDGFNPLWITVGIAGVGGLVAVGRWSMKVDAATKGWESAVKSLRKDLRAIREDISRIFLRLPAPRPVAGGSPLRLTEFGEEIAEKLSAKAWAAELAPRLRPKVEGMKPYQVDGFTETYVVNDLTDEMTERVASCAYDFGIKRDGVRSVLRVVLRDELL